MWPGCGQDVARVWPGCGQGVARMGPGCDQGVSRMLPGCGQDVARVWPVNITNYYAKITFGREIKVALMTYHLK